MLLAQTGIFSSLGQLAQVGVGWGQFSNHCRSGELGGGQGFLSTTVPTMHGIFPSP